MNRFTRSKQGIRYFRNGLYIFRHTESDGNIDERISRLNDYYCDTIEISKFTFWFIYFMYAAIAILLCLPTGAIALINSAVNIVYHILTLLLDKLVNLLDIE